MAGGGKVTNTLGNIQQVLKMAQSAAPIVQQYGPMVKNLPMMINMIKAFNESESTEEVEDGDKDPVFEDEEKAKVKVNEKENLHKIESSIKQPKKPAKAVKKEDGISTPKLYI